MMTSRFVTAHNPLAVPGPGLGEQLLEYQENTIALVSAHEDLKLG
jgi:hypothetical protein